MGALLLLFMCKNPLSFVREAVLRSGRLVLVVFSPLINKNRPVFTREGEGSAAVLVNGLTVGQGRAAGG